MASTSGRRSGSSGDSTRRSGASRRESVYIGSTGRDRSLERLRETAAAPPTAERATAAPRGRERDRRPSRPEPARPESKAAREARERREARDARNTSQRRRARLRAVLVVAAVIAVLSGCIALYRSPLFAVKRVEVVGAVHLSAAKVRQLAMVPADATLLRFPADAVAARVSKDPWAADVIVSRLFPDGMRIRIVERVPVAMVDTGQDLMLVDSTGMVIAKRSVEQTSTSIVIRDVPGLDLRPGRRTTSEPLLNAIGVIEGISEALRSVVGSVSAPSIDGTTLYTRDRVEIVFGSAQDARTKDALVQRILDEHRGKVVSIDVRTVDRPTWRGLAK